MKRLCLLALVAVVAGSCWGQSIAIREPHEGSKIRETTLIKIPTRGVPADAYIAILVNGRFIQAVSPEVVGSDFVYPLDTRALKIADGPATVEAVLFLDLGQDKAGQVLGRTLVNVTVDNSSSITVPAEGFDLKYRYPKGHDYVYDLDADTSYSTVSEAQALLGSKGLEVPVDHDTFRFLYGVDNAYSDGDGLVRYQALPDKGKNFAFLRLASSGAQVTRVERDQMVPIYMRLTNKGKEVFGAQPPYFGMDGVSGTTAAFDVFLRLPLPILPSKRVKPGDGVHPGDVWQGAFSLPNGIQPDPKTQKISTLIPAKGTFEAVEYEEGVPCARIRTSIQSGGADLSGLHDLGFDEAENQKLKLESVVWLSLRTGVIVRQEINLVQEATVQSSYTPVAPNGQTGFPGPRTGGNRRGGDGGGGGGQASAEIIRGADKRDIGLVVPQNFNGPSIPGQYRGPNIPGQYGAPGQYGGPGSNGFGAPGATQTPQMGPKQLVRLILNAVIKLEK